MLTFFFQSKEMFHVIMKSELTNLDKIALDRVLDIVIVDIE